MNILYFSKIESTQLYLSNLVRNGKVRGEITVWTEEQTGGVGSRGNSWIGERGNLFFSTAIRKSSIPSDIPPQSYSIYFSMLMRDILVREVSNIFLKWPNDFYLNSQKVGGTITNLIGDYVIVGIGLNTRYSNKFGSLELSKPNSDIVHEFVKYLSNPPSWKDVFSRYTIEFEKSRDFVVKTSQGEKPLRYSKLLKDGSIEIDGEVIFSNR